jgi:hypothetical protein
MQIICSAVTVVVTLRGAFNGTPTAEPLTSPPKTTGVTILLYLLIYIFSIKLQPSTLSNSTCKYKKWLKAMVGKTT